MREGEGGDVSSELGSTEAWTKVETRVRPLDKRSRLWEGFMGRQKRADYCWEPFTLR